MKNLMFGLLLFSILTSGFTCHDCEDELHGSSTFEVAIDSTLEEYSLGDSISLSTSFNALIELDGTSDVFDNRNTTIVYSVQIYKVQPFNSPLLSAVNSFTFIPGNTSLVVTQNVQFSTVDIESVCDNNTCAFDIDIVPNERGIYMMKILGVSLLFDECNSVGIGGKFDVAENNFSICSAINTNSIRYPNNEGFLSDPENSQNLYFFRVID